MSKVNLCLRVGKGEQGNDYSADYEAGASKEPKEPKFKDANKIFDPNSHVECGSAGSK